MSTNAPILRVTVDVTNPGQFLACCGLLELAGRLSEGTLGWFEKDTFAVSGHKVDLLHEIFSSEVTTRAMPVPEFHARQSAASPPKSSLTIDPICLGLPFIYEVDWWLNPANLRVLKTWSGSAQVPLLILGELQTQVRSWLAATPPSQIEDLFRLKVLAKRKPFYFSRRGSMHAIDVGFSLDKVRGMGLSIAPAVEFLAFIGCQRYRPTPRGAYLSYATWSDPLPTVVASAVAAMRIDSLAAEKYQFQVLPRDDHDHYQFSSAQRIDTCLRT